MCETRNTNQSSTQQEKAFVFIIKDEKDKLLAVYENTLESRSSYLFYIKRAGFIEAIRKIHDYFASDIINKRENMASKAVIFPKKIYVYYRVVHNTLYQW